LRKIPRSVEEKILRRWLEGYTQRQAAREFRVGLATVNRVIDDARKRTPDLDELRGLNVMLRKGDSSVVDAVRGARLLDGVNELGVSLDGLESFIKLSERISERGVEAERFIEASMRLTGLEAKTGKSYEEVMKVFEEKMKRIEDLEAKAKGVQGQIQGLMERKAQLESEICKVKERLGSTLQELNGSLTTQERLQKLGLKRVSNLARFVEDFELLRFDVNVVKRLAEWRESLKEMGIDPDALERFVKEKGPLEAQISELERELKDEGKKLKSLRAEVKSLWDKRVSLQGRISKLSKLGIILEKGKAFIPCKVCGMDGVFIDVPNRLVARDAMTRGLFWNLRCAHCGQWGQYSAWDVLANIGWLALPEHSERAESHNLPLRH